MKDGNNDAMIGAFGAYGGRIVSFVILVAFLCCIPFVKSWNRVMARIERDEIEGARDRLKKLLHFTYMLLIPVFTAIFVLADTIQVAIFEKSTSEISAIFRLAAILIVLLSIGVLVSWLLNHMGKKLLTRVEF